MCQQLTFQGEPNAVTPTHLIVATPVITPPTIPIISIPMLFYNGTLGSVIAISVIAWQL
jgi:hypothetical protein